MKSINKAFAIVALASSLGACAHNASCTDGAAPRNHFMEARRIPVPASPDSEGAGSCLERR